MRRDIITGHNRSTYVHNLEAKIKSFENGKQYQKLQDQIRVLTNKNARKERIIEKQHKTIVMLRSKYADSRKKNDKADEIIDEFKKLLDRIDELESELEKVKSEKGKAVKDGIEKDALINSLHNQLNKDSTNSSNPSSLDKPHQKKKANQYNSRVKSGLSVGGQKGHPHHSRANLKATASVTLPLSEEMKNNPNLVKTDEVVSKKLVDIIITYEVIEYFAEVYIDITTNKRVHAPFPKGVKDEINYGPAIQSFILWLSNYCNVSINKIQNLISELTDEEINPSTGYISKLQTNFVNKCKSDITLIENKLILSDFLHTDLTNGNLNGKQINVFNFTNKKEVLYTYSEYKNKDAMSETVLGKFNRALIHDHDTTFYSFGNKDSHQECIAHLLRYLQAAEEEYPNLTWHKNIRELFIDAIHKKKTNQEIGYQETYDKYLSYIQLGYKEYEQIPKNKYETVGRALLKRLDKYSNENFLFLKNDLIDYTNNICERNLRKYKRKQKQAIVFRTSSSIESICAFLSIVETAKLNNKSGYRAIQAIMSR